MVESTNVQFEFGIKQEDVLESIFEQYQEDLRPHQIEALEFMKERNRGVIQCFCGTGKSRIIYEKTMQNAIGNILLVFPSLALVQQFNSQYLKSDQIEETSQVIICDSDHTKSIQEEHFFEEQNIFLTTYASLAKFKEYFDEFNLVIFDEAHHICTKNIINLIQEIINADIFYFTATPKIAKKLLNMYQRQDEIEESKDSYNIINPIDCGEMYVYDFHQALQDGYIVDYELHHCIYQPTTDIILDQFNALVQFAQIHKRTRIIAFNQYINKVSENKTSSTRFMELQSDNVQIEMISAATSPSIRDKIFKWFQDDDYNVTKIIFNASCIKEGIDLPCCDLVVFCDDKQSPINIIQCIGRVTRLSKNKKTAMITAMIPFELEQTAFKIVTNICKALKSVDFRMKSLFQAGQLQEFIKFTYIENTTLNTIEYDTFKDIIIHSLVITEYNWDYYYDLLMVFQKDNERFPREKCQNKKERQLGQWITTNKTRYRLGRLENHQINLFEQLPNWTWQKQIDDQWIVNYQLLKQFYEINNRQPRQNIQTEQLLDQWVNTNKTLIKYVGNQDITKRKKELLELLPLWCWNVNFDLIWDEQYMQLVRYLNINNDTYPKANKGFKDIGVWVGVQKREYSQKKISEYRIQKLELLPHWVWKQNLNEQWLNKVNQLKQFLSSNHKYPAVNSQNHLEKQLHRFVSSQRAAYQKGIDIKGGHGTKITTERVIILEQLYNWTWFLDIDANWESMYQQLKTFIETNQIYPTKNTNKILAAWVSAQKRAHKGVINGAKTSIERTNLLEKLTGWQWSGKNGNPMVCKYTFSQSIIKMIHQIAFTSNTNTLYERFQTNPKGLIDYHEQRERKQSLKPQESLPHNIISNKLKAIKNKSQVKIIDLGCGLNKIAENLKDDPRFVFTSIDFQIYPNSFGNVQQGNIADLSNIDDFSFKYAIMSLCFWGKDFEKSIQECYRILEDPGVLYIIQTKKKMIGFEEIMQNAGFAKKESQELDKYTYIEYRK